MIWRNTPHSFGRISRLLHWAMALLVIGMLVLGNRIADLQPGLANLWLYGLHKGIGMSLLALALLRVIWHHVTPPPRPIGTGLQTQAARAVHLAFYLLLLAIPLVGWVASSATGLDVMLFDRWRVPGIAPVSEVWEKTGFALHATLTKLLVALISLHVLAALKRGWDGDGTLRRMWRGRAQG
ncbi:MAG: cytochrome b [Paracoccaceae bacterium]|nr:cytochrome b [Paracoccaceae bacterium]